MSEFGVRKGLLIEKAPTGEMGDLVVFHAHLARWTRLRVFKGLGEHIFGSAGGSSFIWRTLEFGYLWLRGINNSPGVFWTMVPWLPKGFWCSSSSYVLVFWFRVYVEWGKTLVLGTAKGQSSFLCTHFGCMTWGLSWLSLKSKSASL